MVEDGVRSFGADVTFVDDNTITAQWFYDNASSPYGAPLTYERVAGACCSEGKPCSSGEACEKPDANETAAPVTPQKVISVPTAILE